MVLPCPNYTTNSLLIYVFHLPCSPFIVPLPTPMSNFRNLRFYLRALMLYTSTSKEHKRIGASFSSSRPFSAFSTLNNISYINPLFRSTIFLATNLVVKIENQLLLTILCINIIAFACQNHFVSQASL